MTNFSEDALNVKTRKEERWIINKNQLNEFIIKIKEFADKKEELNTHNQTLYFNNQEHEAPFDVSLKARRYSSEPINGILDLNESWIFEIKEEHTSDNIRFRKKQREELTVREILEKLTKQDIVEKYHLSLPLTVFVADSYKREQYKVKDSNGFRITIDTDPQYFFFEEGLTPIKIGEEDCVKIEIKIPLEELKSDKIQKINDILNELNAEPSISKKDTIYNMLRDYLNKKYNHRVPKSDTEIEAKLILNKEDQYLFHQIKKDFKQGEIKGFQILEDFPYTLENGTLHQYLVNTNQDHNVARVSIKGDKKVFTVKGKGEIIQDQFNLNCIIKRQEKKYTIDEVKNIISSELLHRKRKYFIVKNILSKETYCILIDRCTDEENELYQMEIEGLLISSENKEQELNIINDISNIVNHIVKKYPQLQPSTLTKQEWLWGLKDKSTNQN